MADEEVGVEVVDVPRNHRLLEGWLPFRLSLTIAWYDLWVGAYFDHRKRRLYILPLPMVGICIQFPARDRLGKKATGG